MKQKKESVNSKTWQKNFASQSNQRKVNFLKSEYSLKDLWDNIKQVNIHIRQKRKEKLFEEIVSENFP